MLGLYAVGTHPAAAVVFLMLMGGALGPVFMTTQNAMLLCAPGSTDIALAANSGSYNADIAAGAALGGLALPLAGVRGTFLVGGLLTAGACTVLLGGRLLHDDLAPAEWSRPHRFGGRVDCGPGQGRVTDRECGTGQSRLASREAASPFLGRGPASAVREADTTALSTAGTTGRPTPPCTRSCRAACASTRAPGTTTNGASRKARPDVKSSDAANARLPGRSFT
jgi:hypothetical protein